MDLLGFRRRRRARVRARPFPEDWQQIVERSLPRWSTLTAAERAELLEDVALFLDEKRFEGAGGLEITDEIRVTIAAGACLLLLHRETDLFPTLHTVVVYPGAFVVRNRPTGAVTQGERVLAGQSSTTGTVVLSWDSVQRGLDDPHDGHDVILHELAHQLDAEDGSMDGAPVLPTRGMYGPWAAVLGEEYAELIDELQEGRRGLIDPYGAVSPAEFFAVLTELFFERPRALQQRHPELYGQLRTFYQQDPGGLG